MSFKIGDKVVKVPGDGPGKYRHIWEIDTIVAETDNTFVTSDTAHWLKSTGQHTQAGMVFAIKIAPVTPEILAHNERNRVAGELFDLRCKARKQIERYINASTPEDLENILKALRPVFDQRQPKHYTIRKDGYSIYEGNAQQCLDYLSDKVNVFYITSGDGSLAQLCKEHGYTAEPIEE